MLAPAMGFCYYRVFKEHKQRELMYMSSLSLLSHFFFFFFLGVCAGCDKSVFYLFSFFPSVVMFVGLYIRLLGSECSLRG